jgi:hypothetical protein
VSHPRAKLNAYGRRLLCARIQAGFPVRVAARMVGISHARAYSPRRPPGAAGAAHRAAASARKRGPARIAFVLGIARSTERPFTSEPVVIFEFADHFVSLVYDRDQDLLLVVVPEDEFGIAPSAELGSLLEEAR